MRIKTTWVAYDMNHKKQQACQTIGASKRHKEKVKQVLSNDDTAYIIMTQYNRQVFIKVHANTESFEAFCGEVQQRRIKEAVDAYEAMKRRA